MENSLEKEFNKDLWEYVNEGNQHIVCCYCGENLSLVGKIIRLSKENIKKENEFKWFDQNFSNIVKEKLYNKLEIWSNISIPKQIEIHNLESFLKDISIKIEKNRPEKRKLKKIDKNTKVFIEEDFSLNYFNKILPETKEINKIVIEIKPKSGLIDYYYKENIEENLKEMNFEKDLIESYIDFIINDLTERNCKFYKKQLEKLEKNDEKELSLYNPQELFSFSEEKIRISLEKLIKNPQNNLRINSNCSKEKEYLIYFEKILFENLFVLKDILKIQKLYMFPVSFSFDLYEKLIKINNNNEKELFEKLNNNINNLSKNINFYEEIIENIYRDYIKNENFEFFDKNWKEKLAKTNSFLNNESYESYFEEKFIKIIEYLLKFLISYTWRDISIIIKACEVNKKDLEISEILIKNEFKFIQIRENFNFFYKIGIIDTDLKNFKKVPNFMKDDKELLKIYIKNIENIKNKI